MTSERELIDRADALILRTDGVIRQLDQLVDDINAALTQGDTNA